MRIKKIIEFPEGYPYVLFEISAPHFNKYIVACSKDHALDRAKVNRAKAEPALLARFIKNNGHHHTNFVLKHFGRKWMTKNGYVFYPTLEPSGTYIEYVRD